jgi:hypothetical protein
MKNPTLVVVIDRNELHGQLYQQFRMARSAEIPSLFGRAADEKSAVVEFARIH